MNDQPKQKSAEKNAAEFMRALAALEQDDASARADTDSDRGAKRRARAVWLEAQQRRAREEARRATLPIRIWLWVSALVLTAGAGALLAANAEALLALSRRAAFAGESLEMRTFAESFGRLAPVLLVALLGLCLFNLALLRGRGERFAARES